MSDHPISPSVYTIGIVDTSIIAGACGGKVVRATVLALTPAMKPVGRSAAVCQIGRIASCRGFLPHYAVRPDAELWAFYRLH
jgi:hypothetical protein